jgi:hypothetical protein
VFALKFNKKFTNRINLFLALFLLLAPIAWAASSVTHTSQVDFEAGTFSSEISSTQLSGSLQLNQSQSYISTTNTDFLANITDSIDYVSSLELTNTEDGELKLNKDIGYCYNDVYSKLETVTFQAFDNVNNLIFFATSDMGVQVINTKGTYDPTDDEIITEYTTTSTPASVGDDHIFKLEYDSSRHLLYISTWSSADVIDTKGNDDPSDDETVASYTEFSSPVALDGAEGDYAQMLVHEIIYDDSTDYLWVRTANEGGLEVIDTKGTPSMADDTYVAKYNIFSVPVSSGNSQSGLAVVNGIFYEATSFGADAGIFVGNSILGSNVGKYTTSSTPGAAPDLPDNAVQDIYYSESENRLYVLNYYDFTIIDTQGTPENIGDDTLVSTFHSTELLKAFSVDETNDLVYITQDRDIIALETTNLTEVARYNSTTTPYLGYASIPSEVRINGDQVYVHDCVFSISNTGDYYAKGQFTSEPIQFTLSSSKIKWEQTISGDQSIVSRYRTASDENDFVDDFLDNVTANVGDFYSYGPSSVFGSVNESGGILTLSDPPDTTNYIWVDTGKADDFYPAGSTVSVRMRVNTSDPDYAIWLFGDDYDTWSKEFTSADGLDNWVTIRFTPTDNISKVGIELDTSGSWQAEDSVEIESVTVRNPIWSSWSTTCSSNTGCDISIPGNHNLLQYQLILNSDSSLASTPTLKSVTLGGVYPESGEFTSALIDGGTTVDWSDLTFTGSTPSNTSITFYTRSGDSLVPDGTWSSWAGVNSPISSPNSRYLQYKVVLASTDAYYTPTLESVTLQYSTVTTDTTDDDNSDSKPDNGKIVINSSDGTADGESAKFTNTRKVKLYLDVDGNGNDVTEMKLSTRSDFGNKDWIQYTQVKDFVLDDKEGEQTVYVKFKDEKGNESKVYSRSIDYRVGVLVTLTGTGNGKTTTIQTYVKETSPSNGNLTKPPETSIISTIPITETVDVSSTPEKNKRSATNVGKLLGETLSAFSSNTKFGLIAFVTAILPFLISSIMEIILSIKYIYLRSLPSLIVGLIRKKKHPWGVVYDSVSKQPIDPAIVTLTSDTGKIFQTVTDMYGRYQFFVEPGKYKISVEKTSFAFPSKIIISPLIETVYPNALTTTEINVSSNDKVDINIPMDRLEGNWNQIEKVRMGINGQSVLLIPLANLAFWLGLLWNMWALYLHPVRSTYELAILFLLMLIYRTFFRNNKSWGVVKNKHGQVLPGTVVNLVLAAFPNVNGKKVVTDYLGRYNFLVEKGTFQIFVDKEIDGQKNRVFESRKIVVNKKFSSIAPDITI